MLTTEIKQDLQKFIRATNYLSVAQIFLQDNFLLERPLIPADIKPRLLGHWGTCPGINVIYAHLNLLIKQQSIASSIFILGPGHGFPALQANLFLEQSLENVDNQASLTANGIAYIAKNFSWPYGFASHANPQAPGVISEGGELGYSLATAFGSVLDQSNLISFCLIGDGEAETAALAGAWHLAKLLNPESDGAVLPILHLNGYKISGPTFFGRMSDKEIIDYFTGLRYRPMIVDYNDQTADEQLHETLSKAYRLIQAIKSNQADDCRWPVIIFRSDKGLTGPTILNGKKLAGNNLSHQVMLSETKTDSEQLAMLEKWLRSYHFEELFDGMKFTDFTKTILPTIRQRMGNNRLALGLNQAELSLPDIEKLAVDRHSVSKSLSMNKAGEYLREVFKINADKCNFRLFSPDETTSNRLQAVFAATKRAWNLPIKPQDDFYAQDGRVMEILSEQELQGMYQGYNLTGRYGAMTSYEAFMPVAGSMVDQYAKFLKQAAKASFRASLAPMVYLLTSVGWRQDHNGFSHQNPGFIANILNHQSGSNVYFPSDQNAMLAVLERVYQSRDNINAIVAGKQPQTIWRNIDQAQIDVAQGATIFSEENDSDNSDIVLAAAGDYLLTETMAAYQLIKQELPETKIRVVYVSSLTCGAIGSDEQKMTTEQFNEVFTEHQPIIFNFHGYPETIKSILFNYLNSNRASVHGYIEEGSTTTPFDMMVRNQTSRWHLLLDVADKLVKIGKLSDSQYQTLHNKYQLKLVEHVDYIKQYGVDLPEIV
ncbi:MAG: phosphoketolase family protein [Candidatus Saccharibacteria bacterium]|nr:phosphoketolase family protein [Candidatus Saccharibacteria bacterium]